MRLSISQHNLHIRIRYRKYKEKRKMLRIWLHLPEDKIEKLWGSTYKVLSKNKNPEKSIN